MSDYIFERACVQDNTLALGGIKLVAGGRYKSVLLMFRVQGEGEDKIIFEIETIDDKEEVTNVFRNWEEVTRMYPDVEILLNVDNKKEH